MKNEREAVSKWVLGLHECSFSTQKEGWGGSVLGASPPPPPESSHVALIVVIWMCDRLHRSFAIELLGHTGWQHLAKLWNLSEVGLVWQNEFMIGRPLKFVSSSGSSLYPQLPGQSQCEEEKLPILATKEPVTQPPPCFMLRTKIPRKHDSKPTSLFLSCFCTYFVTVTSHTAHMQTKTPCSHPSEVWTISLRCKRPWVPVKTGFVHART